MNPKPMRLALPVLALAVCAFTLSVAKASEISTASRTSFKGEGPSSYYLRVSLMSSRSGQSNGFRTMKGSGSSDESGSSAEATTVPNLSYVSLMGMLTDSETHRLMLVGVQSVARESERTIATPFGQAFTLPGRVIALRYSHFFSPDLSVHLGGVHIDIYGFMDPVTGVTYLPSLGAGWGSRLGLNLSLPMTARRGSEGLITKATARSSLSYRAGDWMWSGSLSHARPFYSEGPSTQGVPVRSNAGRVGAGMAGLRGGMEEVDVVLSEKETGRTNALLSTGYAASPSLRFNGSTGISLISTVKSSALWITTLRPVGVTYSGKQWDAGASLTLTSDIRDFKTPSLPKVWNVEAKMGYAFGDRPRDL